MDGLKTGLAVVAVALTFAGYVPYLRDTLNGKTRPHVYSWLVWGVVTLLAFALQNTDHPGPGSLVTLAAGLICLLVFALALKHGRRDITASDTVFLLLAVGAMGLWVLVSQPVVAVVLLSSIDMLGFLPTIRKSWHAPDSETLSTYVMNTFRFTLALVALQHYTLVTSLYPLTWLFANGAFAALLVLRRRAVHAEHG